jgi:hypothetical protein
MLCRAVSPVIKEDCYVSIPSRSAMSVSGAAGVVCCAFRPGSFFRTGHQSGLCYRPRHDRIDVSCQHHSPEQVALTNNRPRYAMPDNRGEVSIHWRNAQHSEADVIIRYR